MGKHHAIPQPGSPISGPPCADAIEMIGVLAYLTLAKPF